MKNLRIIEQYLRFNCSICMINCMIVKQLIWEFFQNFRSVSKFLVWRRNRLFRNKIYSKIVHFTLENNFCIELTRQTFANCNNVLLELKLSNIVIFVIWHYRFVIIIIIIRTTETSHYWQFTIICWNVDDVAFEHIYNYVQIAKIERLFKRLTIDFWLNFIVAIAIATMYIYKNSFSVHFTLALLSTLTLLSTIIVVEHDYCCWARLSHIVNTSFTSKSNFSILHFLSAVFMITSHINLYDKIFSQLFNKDHMNRKNIAVEFKQKLHE